MKKFALFLAIASIVMIPVTFTIAAYIGQPEIYGLSGLLRYVWVMWLAIPVGVATIIVGFKLKSYGMHYKGTIAAGLVSIAFLALIGSYSFAPDSVYDNEALQPIADSVDFTFPNNVKAAVSPYGNYTLCKGMISSEEKIAFEDQLRNSEKWTDKLDPKIKKLMPQMVVPELDSAAYVSYDLFLFRNLGNGTYNTVPPQNVATPCVLIAYDCETGQFLIVTDYTIEFT